QWTFYVVSTNIINEKLGNRRTVSIPTLEKIGSIKCGFQEIRFAVQSVLPRHAMVLQNKKSKRGLCINPLGPSLQF
ncbi:MAG TPA: hypothetical protein DEB10_12265, partial [Ruminococcaceae bacterium]|nr:hypothetical protein [Oscillospiraceae bacterium]